MRWDRPASKLTPLTVMLLVPRRVDVWEEGFYAVKSIVDHRVLLDGTRQVQLSVCTCRM